MTRLYYPPVSYENGRSEAGMVGSYPPSAYLAPAPPRHRDYLLVMLLMVAAGAVGAGAVEYAHWQRASSSAEPTITLPPEIHVRPGEPQEVEATTGGRRVCWLALDPEISLRPSGAKSVWVWGRKSGDYRVIAWSATGDVPTLNASMQVVVEPGGKGEK